MNKFVDILGHIVILPGIFTIGLMFTSGWASMVGLGVLAVILGYRFWYQEKIRKIQDTLLMADRLAKNGEISDIELIHYNDYYYHMVNSPIYKDFPLISMTITMFLYPIRKYRWSKYEQSLSEGDITQG